MLVVLPLLLGLVLGAVLTSWNPRRPAAVATDTVVRRATATTGSLTYRADTFAIRTALPPLALPYARTYPSPRGGYGLVDAHGVRMLERGGRTYDHPAAQAQYGLNLLESYRLTDDRSYLDLAQRQADRLVATRVVSRGGWFYPYRFDYPGPGPVTRIAPWYAGISQGQALSLFSRLALVTGRPTYREAADRTFASLTLGPRPGSPWVTWTKDGLLWFEEYPNPRFPAGARVYNGHMFATFGVFDYVRLTGSGAAAAMLRGAMTTAREFAGALRRPGRQSKYCVAYDGAAHHYHATHVYQLLELAAITGDRTFATWADAYHADDPGSDVPGAVVLEPGTVVGYRFGADGSETAAHSVLLTQRTTAPASGRTRVAGRPGYFFAVTAGSFAGYLVPEEAGRAYQRGQAGLLLYPVPRAVTFRGPTTVTAFDGAGAPTRATTRFRAGDTALIDRRATMGGREYLRLSAGDARGTWVLAGAVSLR